MPVGTPTGFVNFTNGTPRADKIIATSNIGIGTNAPAYELDVAGDINFSGSLYENGVAFSGGGDVWTETNSNIYYNTGNVGIGTATPTAELDVNGVIKNQNPSWNLYKEGDNGTTGANSGVIQYNIKKVTERNCTLNTSGGYYYRVTITVAGRYYIGFNAFTESNVSTGTGVNYEVWVNGDTYVRNYHTQPYNGYGAMGGLGCLADLSVNDYVEIHCSHLVHWNINASFYGFMIG